VAGILVTRSNRVVREVKSRENWSWQGCFQFGTPLEWTEYPKIGNSAPRPKVCPAGWLQIRLQIQSPFE
jgi:hypothetical protein